MKHAASLLVMGLIVSAGTSPAMAERTPEAATDVAWQDAAREIVTEIALPGPKEGPWLVVGPFSRDKFDRWERSRIDGPIGSGYRDGVGAR